MNQGKLALQDVTLVAVTSVALQPTIGALHASMRQATFGKVLLLSDRVPAPDSAQGIECRQIERLMSRQDYSRFMLHQLSDHIGAWLIISPPAMRCASSGTATPWMERLGIRHFSTMTTSEQFGRTSAMGIMSEMEASL